MFKDKLLSSFLKFSAGSWVKAGIGFLAIPIATRLIMPEEFGKAAMFTLALQLMLRILMLGSDQAFVRKFHGVKAEERSSLLWNSLLPPILTIILSVIIILLLWQEVSLLLFESLDFLAILILVFTCIIAPIDELARNVVRMSNRALAYSSLLIAQSIIQIVVLIGYAIFIEPSFYAIIYGVLAGRLTTGLIAIYLEKKIWFCGNVRIKKKDLLAILNYGLPFVPSFIFMWILQAMDKFMLRTYTSLEEVGIYSAAFKIVAAIQILKAGFQHFWIPVSMEHYEKEPENTLFFEKMALRVVPLILLIGSGVILFKNLVIIILGSEYSEAAILIPLLVFIPIGDTIIEVVGKGIAFKNKTYWYMIITAVAAIVNLIGNYFLIPIFAARGASLGTAISYLVFLFLTIYISYRFYKVNYHIMRLFIALAMLFFCALIITFNKEIGLNYSISIILPLTSIVVIIWLYLKPIKNMIG